MSRNPIRALIVEDRQVVAEGLAALLNDQEDMTVVGKASSVAESGKSAEAGDPDVLLLDFRLTDGTGADAGAAVHPARPGAKLILLTPEGNDASRLAALGSGGSGFITKSRAPSLEVDD